MAGEAPRQTVIIQDKIAIWTAHQPVKNEPADGFPIPQGDTSCKEIGDYVEAL
jgi:hypothetical protein